MDELANRNTYWAHIFVDELYRAGLRSVVVAPGSRSTPLALALDRHPGIEVYVHPDERGAAFMALGLALGSGQPTAVLCTSGTAAANFFPAIIEAYMSNIPLLVFTADRPPELRDSGTNQSIDQLKLYGNYVRWFVEAPLPEANPQDTILGAMRSLAGRAMAAAQASPAGPVHINFPFRKPLEPTPVPQDIPEQLRQAWASGEPSPILGNASQGQENESRYVFRLASQGRPEGQTYVSVSQGRLAPSPQQVDVLLEIIRQARRGLIYAGPRCPAGDFPAQIDRLAQLSGFPIFADALSGLRFNARLPEERPLIISGYETFLKLPALQRSLAPDVILQFGALPISKSLADFMQQAKSALRIQIAPPPGNSAWADDAFNTSQVLWVDPELTCQALNDRLVAMHLPGQDRLWVSDIALAERLSWNLIDELRKEASFEGGLLPDILDVLDAGDHLFLASSLPVRHLDQFGQARPVGLRLHANRGASGIDGTLASAAGVAAAHPDQHVVLVIGDLAFLHDLNSLLAVRNYAPNLKIVLINNNGGGIFERLPIASYDPSYTRLFRVPHGLNFAAAGSLFGLQYFQVQPGPDFREVFGAIMQKNYPGTQEPTLLEVSTDVKVHEQVRQELTRRFGQLWDQEHTVKQN